MIPPWQPARRRRRLADVVGTDKPITAGELQPQLAAARQGLMLNKALSAVACVPGRNESTATGSANGSAATKAVLSMATRSSASRTVTVSRWSGS